MEKLGLKQGSVSIFGLLNDEDNEVELFIDSEFYEEPVVHFHPNRNTASVELSNEMLQKFLESIDHEANIIELT
jgi:Ala-tRNA(Pro) deacylase